MSLWGWEGCAVVDGLRAGERDETEEEFIRKFGGT